MQCWLSGRTRPDLGQASGAQAHELLTKPAFCQKWCILNAGKTGCYDAFENDAQGAKCQK